jgi:hypothetical protein
MPGAAERGRRRAQPGALDLLEVDPANCLRRPRRAARDCCTSGIWIGRAEGRVFSADQLSVSALGPDLCLEH